MEKINVKELNDNVFETIGKEWMLVCAGNKDKFNMMTALSPPGSTASPIMYGMIIPAAIRRRRTSIRLPFPVRMHRAPMPD